MNNNKLKYNVFIVGAGISGIAAGNYLYYSGLNIKILDNGKAIGGRLAMRKINSDDKHIKVDYGCKYIEANSSTTVTVEMSKDCIIKNWDKTNGEIANIIIEEASDFINAKVIKYQIHKWKYSTPIKIYPKKFEFIMEPRPIYFAGDAFLGNNVESAYLSGLYAAKSMSQILSHSLLENEIQ